MIFVTVGTDLPFNRMIRVVDEWAADRGRRDIFAQIGETDWRPKHLAFRNFLDPAEFDERFAAATAIVAHAGMGTILSALRFEKPILVMPRLASLGEQRNEHQLATARRLSEMGRINVAFDEASLRVRLHELDSLPARGQIGPFAGAELLASIRDFIASGPRPFAGAATADAGHGS